MASTARNDEKRIEPGSVENAAERVLVSFRPPEADADGEWWVAESPWVVEQMDAPSYRRYLHRAHAGPVAVGDEWEEFVNCGCASPEDVRLRVEEITGGDAIGSETTIEVVPRNELSER